MTPEQRRIRAQIGAHASWAKTVDRTARTAPAVRASIDRFEKQVDPDGVLDSRERAKRAQNAMKAHMLSMALKSARVRARRKQQGTS